MANLRLYNNYKRVFGDDDAMVTQVATMANRLRQHYRLNYDQLPTTKQLCDTINAFKAFPLKHAEYNWLTDRIEETIISVEFCGFKIGDTLKQSDALWLKAQQLRVERQSLLDECRATQ